MPLPSPLDATTDEVRATLAPLRHRFDVALYAAGNAFAVGAVVRTAHSFLAREILLVGSEPFYEKAAMGMHRYESIVRLAGADALFAFAAARRRPVVAFEREHATRGVDRVDAFPDDAILLFGSERFGLPEDVLARCDDVLGIELWGVNQSLPLAVAAGVAMHEWARRHGGRRTLGSANGAG